MKLQTGAVFAILTRFFLSTLHITKKKKDQIYNVVSFLDSIELTSNMNPHFEKICEFAK